MVMVFPFPHELIVHMAVAQIHLTHESCFGQGLENAIERNGIHAASMYAFLQLADTEWSIGNAELAQKRNALLSCTQSVLAQKGFVIRFRCRAHHPSKY